MEGSQDEQGVSADNSKPVCDETQQLKELIASLEDKLDKKKLINQLKFQKIEIYVKFG